MVEIEGSIEWSTIIPAFASVMVVAISSASAIVSGYLSSRRAQNTWDEVLNAMDVYERWSSDAEYHTLADLQIYIDRAITKRTKDPTNVSLLFVYGIGILVEVYLFCYSLTAGNYLATAIAGLSLAYVCWSLKEAVALLRKKKSAKDAERLTYRHLIRETGMKMASHLMNADDLEAELKRLERLNQLDERMAAYYSRGSIVDRRLYSDAYFSARQTAENMELERFAKRVMELPESDPLEK